MIYFRNTVFLKLPSKETLKTDIKSPVVPPYLSAKGVDNDNQCSQSSEKKHTNKNNSAEHENALNNQTNMNEPNILNNSTFAMRMANKIENWSPSTARYARLSIFGCKVSINRHTIYIIYYLKMFVFFITVSVQRRSIVIDSLQKILQFWFVFFNLC